MHKFSKFINEKKDAWLTDKVDFIENIQKHCMGMIIPLPDKLCSCNKYRLMEDHCYCGKVKIYPAINQNNKGDVYIHLEKA